MQCACSVWSFALPGIHNVDTKTIVRCRIRSDGNAAMPLSSTADHTHNSIPFSQRSPYRKRYMRQILDRLRWLRIPLAEFPPTYGRGWISVDKIICW